MTVYEHGDQLSLKEVNTEQLLSTELPDDEKLYFGDDKDFSIRFDGNNLYIYDEVAGDYAIHMQSNGRMYIRSPGAAGVFSSQQLRMNENRIRGTTGVEIYDDSQLSLGTDVDITFEYDSTNAQLKVSGTDLVTETADGMTADPESASEDGFLTIRVGTNVYQIALYSA